MDTLQTLQESIAAKKVRLDALRPLSRGALLALQKSYDVELTYTSNALEGNTLTLRETAEVIEHGITAGGKTLREHLEAANHYEAVLWMRELAAAATPLGEASVCDLHRRIVLRSQPHVAGVYSSNPRRWFARDVPEFRKRARTDARVRRMARQGGAAPPLAFEAHFKLASIHPFADGNGRTARLLMNLMLLRGSYPPVMVQ